MTTIAQQILDLQDMTAPQLAKRYEELFDKPPRIKNKAFLQRRVAWRIQELTYGGLSNQAKTHLDELIAQIDLPLGDLPRRGLRKRRRTSPGNPLIGTTLVRHWKGQEIRVEVLDDGFEWQGVVHKSLSAVAKAVTGSHWNGRLFFGLTKRKTR